MEKLKQRKIKALGKTDIGKYMVEEEPGNAEDLKLLTSYVDILSRKGYYDIYTDSFEKIKYKLSTSGKSKKGKVAFLCVNADCSKTAPRIFIKLWEKCLKKSSDPKKWKSGAVGVSITPFCYRLSGFVKTWTKLPKNKGVYRKNNITL